MTQLPRALLVDDTPDIRLLVRITLESGGIAQVVQEAGNGLEGVEAAAEHRPDLIMLDLAMPVMDGLEALPKLRKLCADATIIVMSGFEETRLLDEVMAAGADGYLQKGASPHQVQRFVAERLLEKQAKTEARQPKAVVAPLDLAGDLQSLGLEAAPFGIIGCTSPRASAESASPAVTFVNAAAARMLGCDQVVADLAACSPFLAGALEKELAAVTAGQTRQARIATKHGVAQVTFVPVADRLLVYLTDHQAASDGDAALLRRAIGVAAHEIRNPVAVLIGVADAFTVLGDQIPEDRRALMLEAVRRQAVVLDRLTQDLLTTSQMHHGSLRLEPRDVSVVAVLQEIAGGQLPDSDYRVDCPEDLEVHADPVRLEQMITNLVTNAVKYGKPKYELSGREDGGFAVISVIDHGPGVPPEFEPDLFGEFRRAEGTRARGTGLGLWVVRSLAESHGGSATYERARSGGARFILRLPRPR